MIAPTLRAVVSEDLPWIGDLLAGFHSSREGPRDVLTHSVLRRWMSPWPPRRTAGVLEGSTSSMGVGVVVFSAGSEGKDVMNSTTVR